MSKSELVATVQLYAHGDGTFGALVSSGPRSQRTDGWATKSACLDHVARLLADGASPSTLPPARYAP